MKRVVLCNDQPYFVVELEDNRGWFLWAALKVDSEVYHVGPHGCTCPVGGACKHVAALIPVLPNSPKRVEPVDKRHSRG